MIHEHLLIGFQVRQSYIDVYKVKLQSDEWLFHMMNGLICGDVVYSHSNMGCLISYSFIASANSCVMD